MPCVVNVREEQQIVNAVEKAVKTFGGKLRHGGRQALTGRLFKQKEKNLPSLLMFCFFFFIKC